MHSFTEGYQHVVSKEITLNDVISTLRQELVGKKDEYQSFLIEDIDLLEEYKTFLQEPLNYYNLDPIDLFLYALGGGGGGGLRSEHKWI